MLAYPAIVWQINRPHAANGYGTKMCTRNYRVPLTESQHHIIDPTNSGCALDNGVEDRLHIRWRTTDDAEHLGGCSLMLQSFAQLCVAFLDLFEQAHILDGDDSLISEGFEKFDLFFSKRSNFLAADCDHSDRNTLSQQRRADCGSHPCNRLSSLIVRELCQFCCDIMHVYGLTVDYGSARWRPATKGSPLRLRNRHRPIYG